MPIYLDVHSLNNFTKDQLQNSIETEADEYRVLVHQMLFNEKEDVMYCICEAPSVEAVEKHHMAFNTKCDKIIPINQINTDKIIKEEKLRVIGQLSSRLSHDLRNPLAAIKSIIDLMQIETPEPSEKQKERFSVIEKAIKRIDHQVSDVLGYLKTKELKPIRNSVIEIIESSTEGINIPEGIKITKPDEDIAITCEFEGIRTVFSNIILNAIQAIEQNGEIKITVEKKDNVVTISFENSGPMIPEKNLLRIFEPLFTTKFEGTGLGLSSCKSIVVNHGGMISASNYPTTFKVVLP